MSINNFKKLGHLIDERLGKLEKIWETPHMLISNTEPPDAEAQSMIEHFLVNINKVHDELNELVEEQIESTTDVKRFVDECKAIVNDSVKPDCDALEAFLRDHGYTPLLNINETQLSESSILKDELLELSLLDKKTDVQDSSDYLGSDDDQKSDKENFNANNKPTCIPTPVIKRLNHVRTFPREPIYSPYFKK